MNEYNKRREFIKATGKVAGFGFLAASFSSIITSCEQDELPPKPPSGLTFDVDLNAYPVLLAAGSNLVVTVGTLNGGQPVLIKHKADDTFIVMDVTCRHQNCGVKLPDTEDGVMVCQCHGATFSFADGKSVDNKGFSTATDMKIFESTFNASKKLLTITS